MPSSAAFTPEYVEEMGMKLFMRYLETLPVERRLSWLKPEDILRIFEPKEVLQNLKPEDRLKGLKPEDRLSAVRPHYDDDIPTIWANPKELHQVWTHLIHNAIQAMKGKGTLEIVVKEPTPGPSKL